MVADKLRESLSAMPVPEPRPGFVDRVLANAKHDIRRPFNWWAAGLGALAATIACVALLWKPAPAAEPTCRLILETFPVLGFPCTQSGGGW